MSTRARSSSSVWQRIKGSFITSVGDIVFGMEDGTVSIFGLVFGVAASASNDKAVLLAGATGAVAAAVSMMAGAYLDVSSRRSIAFTPVIPFMLFALDTARIVSVIVTTLLLLIVGVGRGIISHRNVVLTALETLGIAAAAAVAGVLIGILITRLAG